MVDSVRIEYTPIDHLLKAQKAGQDVYKTTPILTKIIEWSPAVGESGGPQLRMILNS